MHFPKKKKIHIYLLTTVLNSSTLVTLNKDAVISLSAETGTTDIRAWLKHYSLWVVSFFKIFILYWSESVSHPVMFNSVWPHGLQHAKLPCSSLSPRACSNSCPLSQWCHPTISSSVTCFSSCSQSFPVSGSFPISQLFTLGWVAIPFSRGSSWPRDLTQVFCISGRFFTYCAIRNSNGRKWRGTKEPPDEDERGKWKTWLKTQHPKK